MKTRLVTPEERALAIAAEQYSAISGRQARTAGMTAKQVRDRVDAGKWKRPVRDVFTIAGSSDTWKQRAMVAYLATEQAGGTASHATCGAVFGVLSPSPLPHITLPPGRSPRCGVAKIHRARLSPQDRQPRDGMWVTTPSRLLVDMATWLARAPLEDLTDDVLCRGLASVASVRASLARAGPHRRGATLLAQVLEVWTPEIRPGSVAEVRLLRRLGELGLRELVTQHAVYDADGTLIGKLDVSAPDLRKGLEYDSVEFHNPRRWRHDEARYQRFRAAGWDVEGVTKADLMAGETRLARIVERWLAGPRPEEGAREATSRAPTAL